MHKKKKIACFTTTIGPVFIAILVIELLGASEYARYSLPDISTGQWWRLLSGHLAHFNANHMWMNLIALLVLYGLFNEAWSPTRFWACYFFSAISISLLISVVDPELTYYYGFSGINYALLFCFLILDGNKSPVAYTLVLVIFSVRLLQEQMPTYNVHYLQTVIYGPVYPNAHLWGAVSGALVGLVLACCIRPKPDPEQQSAQRRW